MVTLHMKKTHSLIMRSSPLLCRERSVQVTHGEQRDFYHQLAHIQNNEPFFHRGGSSFGGSGIADPNVLPCLCNDEHPKDLHRHHDEGTSQCCVTHVLPGTQRKVRSDVAQTKKPASHGLFLTP